MNEWMVKCEHTGCKKWNILDDKCVGDHGTICRACGKPLDVSRGEWVMTNENYDGTRQGFKVNVLMFDKAPWVEWKKDVLLYREENSEAAFFNEVLGLEYDSGVIPVTEEDIKACCTGGPMCKEDNVDSITKSEINYMGLDYGPVNSSKSNTVMAVMRYNPAEDMLKVLFAKKFLGVEASYAHIHEHIPALKDRFNCKIIGADYGLGEAPTAEIRKRIGFDSVISYQHVPTQKERMQYNSKLPAYTLSRTTVMTDFFTKIKQRRIEFPCWADFEPFAQDILNIHIEYNEEKGTMRYVNDDSDDFFHTLIYGGITAEYASKVLSEVY
tara:strand:+ start:76 stop:1053 length:978 start_codon:yes stop_codon:yes gene_type:complete